MQRAVAEVGDDEEFRACIHRAETPVVLRDAATAWASVAAGRTGPGAMAAFLRERNTGEPVYAILGQPDIGGRFGFDEGTRAVNYAARQMPLDAVLARFPDAEAGGFAIAVQALPVRAVLRAWDAENANPWTGSDVEPTMWISMPSRVAPHSDVHDNIAVVTAGARRFTLFPPEQIDNLYLGPLLASPGGVPTSSVDIWDPDLERHPRFAEAAATAQSCTLRPGDALFIPSLWWHAVESLERFNVLVNFWFGGDAGTGLSLPDTLAHAILAISALPEAKRRRWKAYFDHLVFRIGQQPGAHLPPDVADLITRPSKEQAAASRERIAAGVGPEEP